MKQYKIDYYANTRITKLMFSLHTIPLCMYTLTVSIIVYNIIYREVN